MANVLMIYSVREPTNIILENTFMRMSQTYDLTLRSSLVQKVTHDDVRWCDILLCVRPVAGLIASIARIAKKCGKMIILFNDDNFLGIKDFKVRRYFWWKALNQSLKLADVIISSNESLADQMCSLAGISRKTNLDMVVEADGLHPYTEAQQSGTINVAYYVNDGSPDAFDAQIGPILPALWERYGDRIHWTFFSVHPELQLYEPINVTYYKRMSLDAFREKLCTGSFHIGLAPLLDNEFSNCKYINKFIEYTKAGIPCIYSNVPPYDTFIQNGKTGILADNTAQDWLQAFEIMADPLVRKNCIEGAQQQIRDEFSERRIFQKLVQDVPELVAYKAPPCKGPGKYALVLPRVQESLRKMVDPLLRIYARWRLEGFISVCKWTWNQYICKRGS